MIARSIRLAAAAAITTTVALNAAKGAPLDITAVNGMDRASFVDLLGPVFEKSSWVAEAVFEKKPFANAAALYGAMIAIVAHAPAQKQLALLQAHPDLAGREAAAGVMTASSVSEQTGAGLNALSREEMAEIAQLNAAHERKFGFPFIIAVRSHPKSEIIASFHNRIESETQAEYAEDLRNVYAIAKLRLMKLVTEP